MNELFENSHVSAAVLFTDLGHFIFVEKDPGNPKIISSKFLRERQVRAAFTGTKSDTGWISYEVVRAGYDIQGPFYVAEFAPTRRTIEIKSSEKSYTLIWPVLILIGAGGNHYLYAVKGLSIKDGSVMLYRAPFPNVYDDGKICWGENEHQSVDASKAREIFDLFFASAFNNDLSQGKTNTKTKLEEFYAIHEDDIFPDDELVPMRVSLDEMLRRLLVEVKR